MLDKMTAYKISDPSGPSDRFMKQYISRADGSDVLYTLKNVTCLGVHNDHPNHIPNQDLTDKKKYQMPLELLDQESNTKDCSNFIDSLRKSLDCIYKLSSTFWKNRDLTQINENCFPLWTDAKLDPKHIRLYPRINIEKVPIMDDDGNLFSLNDFTKETSSFKVNIVLKLSCIRGSIDKKIFDLQTPLIEVVCVEIITKPVAYSGLTDSKEIVDGIANKLLPNEDSSTKNLLFEELNDCLQQCKAYMTGSFLLQVIHNESYLNSDVDIFCPSKRMTTMIGFFVNSGGAIDKIYGTNIPNCYNHCNIECITDLSWYGHKIQLISILDTDINTHIETRFDLSFCKIRWNGEELLPKDLKDLNDIATKVGTYNFRSAGASSMERLKKYIERGYRISQVLP